ncbi:MAG: SDR family NAD(P)-dependent oxidoreductase [Arachnia sp.]
MSEWAVVTGASGGLGEAFARELADQGSNVVLVARSGDKMEQLASELSARHGVETLVVPCDLSDPDQRASLVSRLDGLDVHTLVNNAGFGSSGMLGGHPPDGCPRTGTSFFTNAGNGYAMSQRRTPGQVVSSTFAALRSGKPYVVDGPGNKLAAQVTRFPPTRVLVQAASWVATR